ncbi:DUF2938 domain-containing protein [Roseobacter sp. YSTF-M11]|uniref:DUF2938 domain-containing protein n=1 Tax=Roseobacter insulae TaxID=2859783 RepID=A0A9X1FX86_9RHOB|nr:DUF2938 domain-containing protein [Roseobacter insulae]MBW4709775.1 DUF2938 domain-containing protein [Roseobacter insulae]
MDSILMGGLVMGVIATVAMDLWAQFLKQAASQPAPNWGLVGRWVAHIPKGTLCHDDIGTATPVVGETAIGWMFHYAVGIAYGVALAGIMGAAWLAAPSFMPAWIFALLTIGFGWFVLHPGLGLGWAASKTPDPWKARAMGLAAHSVFGLGLWLGALL